jgi:hypothetical protein
MRVHRPNPARPRRPQLRVEQLEDRSVPATFTVSTLADGGAGSLRQAILDANAAPGADAIDFTVAGTILITNGSLPTVTGPVNIDGRTAPGFAGSPVVAIDFHGFGGLIFGTGAADSTLRSTADVNASGPGIILEGRRIVIAGNYVGVGLDGTTKAGNTGNGIEIHASSSGDTIGGTGADDANVISGNGGNGIAIVGAARNSVVANFIGTDKTGTVAVGNLDNGILITGGATGNTIGGTTAVPQFTIKPTDGNVISGNGGDGVLITARSQFNTLSGNFIGVDLSGKVSLGNTQDGVAIVNADNNSLIGTFRNDQPFVFFNVIGGNGGNGLRIDNSDNTIVHANFFGLGVDNQTPVGNALNGTLVEGNSANTTYGGVIPLGNVTAANGQNGVAVQDTASGFLSFNTFSGIGAFTTQTGIGNHNDGFLITSTGSGIVLKVNVVSQNDVNGVEITGRAHGVQLVQTLIGTSTNGGSAMPNGGDGVHIGGHAFGNVVGGVQTNFSVAPRNLISGNNGNGVAVVDHARDNRINFGYIGTDFSGTTALPNHGDGIFIGPGTSGTRIGSRDPNLFTLVSGNAGHGIEMQGSTGNSVIGTAIGVDLTGAVPLPNGGSGVSITGSSNNAIGSTKAGGGDTIAYNLGSGVTVISGSGNTIRGNSIHSNLVLGIDLGPAGNPGVTAPVLTSAAPLPGNTIRIAGLVHGRPGSVVTVDLYANFNDVALGVTEGWFYIGTVNVTIGANRVSKFVFKAYNPPPGVQVFTATATNAAGSTSKFSAGILAVGP